MLGLCRNGVKASACVRSEVLKSSLIGKTGYRRIAHPETGSSSDRWSILSIRLTKDHVQSAEENDVSGTRISNYINSQSDRVKKQCTL